MSNIINYICQWLGYTLHDGQQYNTWSSADQIVLMTGCIVIIIFIITIVSMINRILNRFLMGKGDK